MKDIKINSESKEIRSSLFCMPIYSLGLTSNNHLNEPSNSVSNSSATKQSWVVLEENVPNKHTEEDPSQMTGTDENHQVNKLYESVIK